MEQISDLIFIGGWFISAALFWAQFVNAYKFGTKGVSLLFCFGFIGLNINSIYWSIRHNQTGLISGALASIMALISIIILIRMKWDVEKKELITAFLFDFDGCISDTQKRFHAFAEAMVFERHGIIINPEDITERFAGVHTLEVFKTLLAEAGRTDLSAQTLLREKWALIYNELIPSANYDEMDLLGPLIHELNFLGVPMGIATASPKRYLELLMPMCPIGQNGIMLSDAITPQFCFSVEEVGAGKPDPAVFIATAQAIADAHGKKLSEFEFIVVGDGKTDMQAAIKAGYKAFYLSLNTEFDGNPNILRYETPQELHRAITSRFKHSFNF
jgi:beta-phosphoglucomutase-like phosphatase (HAD superfamily)